MLAALCLLTLASPARAAEDLNAIIAGIAARHSQYRNLKFTYDIQTTGSPPQLASGVFPGHRFDPETATCQLWVLESEDGGDVLRHWRRYLTLAKPQLRADRFASWNGESTRIFVASSPLAFGESNRGIVYPQIDTSAFDCNIFDNFLFLDLTGLNQSVVDARHLDLITGKNFKITGPEGHPVQGKVFRVRGYVGAPRVWHEITVTDSPDHMVVRWDGTTGEDGRLVASYEVTKIGRFDDLAYPQAGKYTQVKLSDAQPAYEYSFEVTNAERIGKEAREEWDIPWPAGTIVNDQVKKEVFTVGE